MASVVEEVFRVLRASVRTQQGLHMIEDACEGVESSGSKGLRLLGFRL